jgi:hypothetical protein
MKPLRLAFLLIRADAGAEDNKKPDTAGFSRQYLAVLRFFPANASDKSARG